MFDIAFNELVGKIVSYFYNNHKTIRFTTVADDSEYEVMSVFYSRVYYKNETYIDFTTIPPIIRVKEELE